MSPEDTPPPNPWGDVGKSSSPNSSSSKSSNPWEQRNTSDEQRKQKSGESPYNDMNLDNVVQFLRNQFGGSSNNSGGGRGGFGANGGGGAYMQPKRVASIAIGAFLALLMLWLASGFYQVATDQAGVVMRFGAFERIDQPGLSWHMPWPIEIALTPVVTAQNTIAVGFQPIGRGEAQNNRMVPEESLMLTQDENVIDVQFTVFWRVSDVRNFLFEIREPKTTIKMAAESVMRDVIGQNKLQFALTDGRTQIAEEARLRLQKLMDDYNAGIVVTQINLQAVSVPDEVREAFQDVVNARLDQERFQNQAAAHVNKVIPEAKGQAAQIVQQALAYRDQKIAIASGDSQRFRDVSGVWANAKEVTEQRLYFDAMQSVLGSSQKIIVDRDTMRGNNGGGSGGVLPLLPLGDLMRNQSSATKAGDAK